MPAHAETRILPHSPDEMYDIVADVARYPEFIPWTNAARIRSVQEKGDHQIMLADLVIGFKMFREKWLSRVTLWPEARRIDTEYIEGPFKHMISNWEFREHPDGCEVRFRVDFEFRNRILQGAAGVFFTEAMQRIVRAFETRAKTIHGTRSRNASNAPTGQTRLSAGE